jgi:hypothetical protein
VTTIADTHDPTEWSLAQRDAINSGRIKGPRTFVSGERAANTREGNPPSIPLQTVDEARAYVRRLVALGVDVIKVDSSISTTNARRRRGGDGGWLECCRTLAEYPQGG